MGFLTLTCGLFLFIKGFYSIIANVYFGMTYIKKIGQVVGFSEEKSGIFQVVIRFLGVNGKEYYLIDGQASAAPRYAQGEFVRILLSRNNSKESRLDHLPAISTSLWYLFWGAVFLVLVYAFFEIKMSLVIVPILIYLGFSEAAKFHNFFRFFRFEVEFKKPKIIDLENAKLIQWSENYGGHFWTDSSYTGIINLVLKFERLTYLFCGVCFLCASIYVYKIIDDQILNSYPSYATYDRPLNHQWTQNLKTKIPMVRYYARDKKIVTALDKQNPFYFDLAPGSKVSILVSKSNPQVMRIDRGPVNHWRSYILLVLSLAFFQMNKYAKNRNAKKQVLEPVIRIRKAG